MAATLPAELVDEILVRLPVEPIIRFESVCKEWHSKIHSTSFMEIYCQHTKNKNKPKLKTVKLEDLYKVAPELQQKPNFIGEPSLGTTISVTGPSSDGIYCLTSLPFDESTASAVHHWRCEIAICDSSIRMFKVLPPFPARFCSGWLAWNSIVSGFDGSSSSYQVVVIIGHKLCSFLVLVYSSKKREWKKLVDYEPEKEPVGQPSATWAFTRRIKHIVSPKKVCAQKLLNGCWHWLVQLHKDSGSAILSFNFARQSFSLMKGPRIGIGHNVHHLDVCVLQDHLVVIRRSSAGEVSVWMMMDYGVERSWILKFKAGSKYGLVMLSAIYGVDYLDLQGGRDGVSIKRLFFTRAEPIPKISVTPLLGDPNEDFSFNIDEILNDKEILERLY